MIGVGIGVTGVGDIQHPVQQRKRRALQLLGGDERDSGAIPTDSRAGDGRRDEHWRQLVGAGCQIERVDMVGIRILSWDILREGVEIHRVRCQIDHGSAGDAHLWVDVVIGSIAIGKERIRRRRRQTQVHMPQDTCPHSRIAGGVKGIHVIILGHDEYDVANTLPWNRQVRRIQRLRIHLTLHRIFEQFTECTCIDIGGREVQFREVLTGSSRVVYDPSTHWSKVICETPALQGSDGIVCAQSPCLPHRRPSNYA